VYFQPVPVGLEPAPDLGVLVIRGIVLNENRSAAAVMGGQPIKEGQVGGSIEDGILLVMEAGQPRFDRAQDLHALTFSGDGDLGRMAPAAPGGMQRRVLTETGLISED